MIILKLLISNPNINTEKLIIEEEPNAFSEGFVKGKFAEPGKGFEGDIQGRIGFPLSAFRINE